MTDATKLLEQIEETSPDVAHEYDEHQAAIAKERDAETAVLERAIAAAKPALRALASRIRKRDYQTGGRDGLHPVSEHEDHDERGVVLIDRWGRRSDSTGNRGSFTGRRLYLLSDGQLAVVEREGSWSHWQGEAAEYETTLSILTPREAMDVWDLEEALEGLAAALAEQAGREKSTAAAKERAERLAALAKLAK